MIKKIAIKIFETGILKVRVLHFSATLALHVFAPPPPPLYGFLPTLVSILHQILLLGRSDFRGLKRHYFAVYETVPRYGILRDINP
jgi:hypothetical protein